MKTLVILGILDKLNKKKKQSYYYRFIINLEHFSNYYNFNSLVQ